MLQNIFLKVLLKRDQKIIIEIIVLFSIVVCDM